MSSVSNNPFSQALASNQDYYETLMEPARNEYKKYSSYSEKLLAIENKIKEWTNLTPEQIAGISDVDFKKNYVDFYIEQRKLREDCERIVNIYETTIDQCAPPLLDERSLIVLQRLKIKVTDIEASYNKVFVTDLNQLQEQKKTMKALSTKVTSALLAMRAAGEPIANKFYPNISIVNGFSGIYNTLTGATTTPSFTKAINSRLESHLLPKAASNPSPQEQKSN